MLLLLMLLLWVGVASKGIAGKGLLLEGEARHAEGRRGEAKGARVRLRWGGHMGGGEVHGAARGLGGHLHGGASVQLSSLWQVGRGTSPQAGDERRDQSSA